MNTITATLLEELVNLDPAELHREAQTARRRLAESSWRMGVCLLAVESRGVYRSQGYSSTVQYAIRKLAMEPLQASELLRAARELQALPRLAEAFQSGRLCWTKIKEMTRVVCPETEAEWLEFALGHTIEQVRRAVVASPREWRQRALAANHDTIRASALMSDEGAAVDEPTASQPCARAEGSSAPTDQVDTACGRTRAEQGSAPVNPVDGGVRAEEGPTDPVRAEAACGKARADDPGPVSSQARADAASAAEGPGARPVGGWAQAPSAAAVPRPGGGPRLVRVILDFTPDQFAEWEQAEGRVRSRLGKRVNKEKVALEMARATLDGATPRARARHLVVLHVDQASGEGWYETQRGRLVASPEVVAEARPTPPARTDDEQPSTGKRQAVPIATLRALQARSGGRCEVPDCGRGAPLHVHHLVPVSEGGGNELEGLQMRCAGCHRVGHDLDYASKPAWERARQKGRTGRASPAG